MTGQAIVVNLFKYVTALEKLASHCVDECETYGHLIYEYGVAQTYGNIEIFPQIGSGRVTDKWLVFIYYKFVLAENFPVWSEWFQTFLQIGDSVFFGCEIDIAVGDGSVKLFEQGVGLGVLSPPNADNERVMSIMTVVETLMNMWGDMWRVKMWYGKELFMVFGAVCYTWTELLCKGCNSIWKNNKAKVWFYII